MSTGDASTWVDGASLGLVGVQAVAVVVSVIFAYLTVRHSRRASREEGERFQELRESERRRATAAAHKTRAEDAEERLRRLVATIADYEDLRAQAMFAGNDANAIIARAGPMKVRLQAAMIAVGRSLEHVQAYVHASNPFPQLELIQPALDEIEESLRVYANASRIPLEGEAG
jgi:hypothetical protein